MREFPLHSPVDGFVPALPGVVFAAAFPPRRGESAQLFHFAGILAIAALFFPQGARLSRDAIPRGTMHRRPHAAVGATTFVLFRNCSPHPGIALHGPFG